MKRIGLIFGPTLMFLALGRAAAPSDQPFTGDIMDSKCAQTGAHAEMMKDHNDIHTAKECTLLCVKQGADFVLFNALAKMTYQLDDQAKVAQFAGSRVAVTGTLDDSNKTIHVTDIKLAPPEVP